jgi:hypothetical protein
VARDTQAPQAWRKRLRVCGGEHACDIEMVTAFRGTRAGGPNYAAQRLTDNLYATTTPIRPPARCKYSALCKTIAKAAIPSGPLPAMYYLLFLSRTSFLSSAKDKPGDCGVAWS